MEVSHLQFAHDTIVFCNSTTKEIESLEAILRCFELMFGLKINYDKSELIGIRTDADMLNDMELVFGCKLGYLPIKYLGIPLRLGIPKRKLWDTVMERIDKKLSSWKDKYLLIG